MKRGLTAQRIWLDLVEERGFSGSYASVQRYVHRIRVQRPEVADVMEHPPGAEAQIDFFRSTALVLDGEHPPLPVSCPQGRDQGRAAAGQPGPRRRRPAEGPAGHRLLDLG